MGCTAVLNRACLDAALPIPREAVLHDWWLALVAMAAAGLGGVAPMGGLAAALGSAGAGVGWLAVGAATDSVRNPGRFASQAMLA